MRKLARSLSIFVLTFGLALSGFAQTQDDFFNNQIIHEIRLDMRPSDWEKLKQEFAGNDYYATDFRWRFNGRDIALEGIGIRSRGRGSRSGIKPGLRVDFDRYDTKQTFLGLKSFVLRNNTQDASMMHEYISMGVLRRMGLPASREAFVKLYVNDAYIGVYTLVESVDKAFLRRHFGEDTGYLYKYEYPPGPPYLFENRGADGALYVPNPFEPETHENAPNSSLLATMIQVMNQATEANFAAAMEPYLDLNLFLAEIAAEQYLAEQDGILGDYGLNNFYLYQFTGKTRFQFIAWDKSNTFESVDRSVWHNTTQNVLISKTLAVPGKRDVFIAGLLNASAAAGATGGWMDQEITRISNLIRDAVYTDPNKLCDPGHTGTLRPCTNEEFEAEVVRMLEFARLRGAKVMAQIQAVVGPISISQQPFSILDRGGSSSATLGSGSNAPVVGYARIQPNTGTSAPAGMAIFSLRQGGVLVTEAAVPAARLMQNARIYAEVSGPVNTGLAIANPNAQPATLTFYFTDAAGTNSAQRTATIPANGQIAAFLNEAPFSGGSTISGSFTFSSPVPVSVVALRGFTNERGEFLITTLPVVELTNTSAPAATTLSHFADGGGWTTQIVLINPSEETISGSVQFVGPGTATAAAQSVNVTIDGRTGSSFAYSIPARSSVRLRTSGAGTAIQVGSVRLITTGTRPEALAIFSFKSGGVTVSEAGVPAVAAGSAFRMYVESGEGGIQSGLALVNLSAAPAVVNFELTTLTGASTGLTGSVTIPANGQSAMFLNQVQGFAALPTSFKGVLRASTSSAGGISMIGLRGRYNERGDFLITTTSPVLESSNPPQGELLFPHFVDSGGYTTQFIIFSGYAGQSSSGTIRYFSQGGQPMDVRLQ